MSLPPQGSSHPTEEKSYSKTSISLIRTGSPVQINITGYDIYFGTTINPHLYKSGYNGTSLADISISPNTTYYRKLITKDFNGSTKQTVVVFYSRRIFILHRSFYG